MNMQKDHWNKIYESDRRPMYDFWLDKYENIFMNSKNTPIIDLGCGFGNDTFYLKERGYEVIACDFSEKALMQLNNSIDNLNVKCFDMKDGLPFRDNSANIIISDFSLHYFAWDDTRNIVKEINRVLIDEGVLLCRVNSTKDTNYGAGQGVKIEDNFYNNNGMLKRFFTEAKLRELFKDWDIRFIDETEIKRYKMTKIVWEILVKKM